MRRSWRASGLCSRRLHEIQARREPVAFAPSPRRFAPAPPRGAMLPSSPSFAKTTEVEKATEGAKFAPARKLGGGGGIRTPGELAPTSDFKSGALNHSATPPEARYNFDSGPGVVELSSESFGFHPSVAMAPKTLHRVPFVSTLGVIQPISFPQSRSADRKTSFNRFVQPPPERRDDPLYHALAGQEFRILTRPGHDHGRSCAQCNREAHLFAFNHGVSRHLMDLRGCRNGDSSPQFALLPLMECKTNLRSTNTREGRIAGRPRRSFARLH